MLGGINHERFNRSTATSTAATTAAVATAATTAAVATAATAATPHYYFITIITIIYSNISLY